MAPTVAHCKAVVAGVLYAAEHVHDHCFVCGRLHAEAGTAPRTCAADACVDTDLFDVAYMDLYSELASKGPEVVALLLDSAIAAGRDKDRREALLARPPPAYRVAATGGVRWGALTRDLGLLRRRVDVRALCALPNVRQVRAFLAERCGRGGATGCA